MRGGKRETERGGVLYAAAIKVGERDNSPQCRFWTYLNVY